MTPAESVQFLRARGAAAILSSAVAVLLCTACAAPSARLAGRVVHDGESLPHAAVTARPLPDGTPHVATTDPDGVYRFAPLPPGNYRLTARAEGSPALGARSGKNPVPLAPGADLWIGLQAVPWEEPAFEAAADLPPGFGSAAGTMYFDGEPVRGAVVDAYLDEGPETVLRGPGFRQSFPSGPEGRYALEELPEGTYHLVARKRLSGAPAGPVVEGDLYGEALANPIPVRSGAETRLDLHLVVKERDDDPNADRVALGGAGIRGTVTDPGGTPLAGLYVFAYRNRTVGHGMPDYRTLPTGPDGTFALALGEGGLFYVGAREHAGGSPRPGEYFGFYEGSPDHGIQVPADETVTGVRIVARKVLAP